MATKKQKREAALAKREAFLAEEAARGRHVQEMDRQHRAAELNLISQVAAEINQRHADILARHGIHN